MEIIIDRINEIASAEGLSLTALEVKINASKGVLTKAFAKKTDIQSKWIVAVAENFPQYNMEWLLTGKGEKTKRSNDGYSEHTENALSLLEETKTLYKSLKEQLDDKVMIIKLLEEKIDKLSNK